MERTPRPDKESPVGPMVSSFIVRVRREGARGGVVERVRDGVKEPFARLADLGDVIVRLLRETHLPTGPHVPDHDDPRTDSSGH
jgi:hypothetical protein